MRFYITIRWKEGGQEPRGNCKHSMMHLQTELADMGYTGDIFTWQRGKIRERLERGVTNAQWNTKFPNVGLVNGEMLKSEPVRQDWKISQNTVPADWCERKILFRLK